MRRIEIPGDDNFCLPDAGNRKYPTISHKNAIYNPPSLTTLHHSENNMKRVKIEKV